MIVFFKHKEILEFWIAIKIVFASIASLKLALEISIYLLQKNDEIPRRNVRFGVLGLGGTPGTGTAPTLHQ
jgi:hypothetical protein